MVHLANYANKRFGCLRQETYFDCAVFVIVSMLKYTEYTLKIHSSVPVATTDELATAKKKNNANLNQITQM